MGESSKDIFLRQASGLVREINTTKATLFNVAGVVGNGAAISPAYVALFPVALIAGMSLFSWGVLVGAVFAVAYILCLVVLSQIMPRSGGDYVYTSRITHPLLGFMEGWTLIWAAAATIGYNAWATVFNIGNLALAGVVIGNGFASFGSTITSNTSLSILGIFAFVIGGLILVSPPRTFHRILSVLSIVSILSVFILLMPLIGFNPDTFATNFQHYTGNTTSQIIQTAVSKGFNPSAPINFASVSAMLAFSLFVYIGYTNSTYLAGELRGNIGKNVAIATGVSLVFQLFANSFYILPFMGSAGYNFINAWAYLFWNAPSSAPLHTAPTTAMIAAIGNPGSASMVLVVGFPVLVIFNFIVILSWIAMGTRVLFAQSMDRLMPKKLASVSSKTNQPIIATIILVIISYVFYLLTVYGYSPVSTAYYATILSFFTLLFPAVNAILIKWRKPNLFKLAPSWATREFLKVPAVAWMGVIWLAFLLPVFGVVEVWGLLSSLIVAQGSALLTSIFSSGVLLAIVLIVASVVWYFAEKGYNKKKGLDLKLVFSEIPPE